jgi:FKBP-type peptidyl-prolyl cis-trans isomerase SlyD
MLVANTIKGAFSMKIAKDKVVSINYKLKDEDGSVIDSTDEGSPLLYIQGYQNIIPGLERELEGKTKGDAFNISVSAIDGYGELNPNLIQFLPKTRFPETEQLQIGMQFQADSQEGTMILTILEITSKEVKVDGNHPLAGKELHFEIEVLELREASNEELQHGHVHGPGGVQHH